MEQSNLKRSLLRESESMRIVDCHSHTKGKKEYYQNAPYDLFTLESYFKRDIQSILGKEVYKGAKTDYERWQRLKAVLEKARNVSYWQHNIQVYKNLFDFADDELTNENWISLNGSIRENTRNLEWYDHVTEKICNLEFQVRNISWFEDWEKRYFKAVLRMEPALYIYKSDIRKALEKEVDIEIKCLDSYKQALAALVEDYKEKGVVGLKLAHSYLRTLSMAKVKEKDAKRYFENVLLLKDPDPREIKLLQDHTIYFLGELALKHNIVFQIHTGIQSNWCPPQFSDPLYLTDLIKTFPEVCFDLLHTGYPYSRSTAILGKHYPNVWVNMAWMYLISPAASKRILSEYLDVIPAYRLLGFGSDVHFPEMIFGHLLMARECIVDVLSEKVVTGLISEELSATLLGMLFRDNALAVYSGDIEILSRPEDQNHQWFQVNGKHIRI